MEQIHIEKYFELFKNITDSKGLKKKIYFDGINHQVFIINSDMVVRIDDENITGGKCNIVNDEKKFLDEGWVNYKALIPISNKCFTISFEQIDTNVDNHFIKICSRNNHDEFIHIKVNIFTNIKNICQHFNYTNINISYIDDKRNIIFFTEDERLIFIQRGQSIVNDNDNDIYYFQSQIKNNIHFMNLWVFELYDLAIHYEYVKLEQAKERHEIDLIERYTSNIEEYIKSFFHNFELFELKNNPLYEEQIEQINKRIEITVKDHALNINYKSYF